MERAGTRWQLVLGGKYLRIILIGVFMTGSVPRLGAESQQFAVAIPALEGPVTMGIFSEKGILVRLMYRDARVGAIPCGLNGLIMTWDGKDDHGIDVAAGNYRARGLVHGPLRFQEVPYFTSKSFPTISPEEKKSPFPADRIILRAAEDELLETRPLISLRAMNHGDAVTVEAEGLPVLTIPLMPGPAPDRVLFSHGSREGQALLCVERGNFGENYLVTGFEGIVPMDAGKLEVLEKVAPGNADAFHPAFNAGESDP